MPRAFQIGIIGMGGYAGAHHEAIQRLEQSGEARLICTCDPNPEAFAQKREDWELARRGVRVFNDYRTMLAACADRMDVLVVPTPIPLHLEMHRDGVEAGIACYLEKPPTLIYTELEAMINRDLAAKKQTFVGFNFIAEPERLALKLRLLGGEFGRIVRGSLVALWRRPISYFQRNNWAGRLRHGDRFVLDSCFGNAMAHFVHNMLFWVGREQLYSWGIVENVRAELYRVNAIEGADTFFVEATAGGVNLRFALTHACEVKEEPVEKIVCERATLCYSAGRDIEINWHNGGIERISSAPFQVPDENHRDYFRYLRGERSRPTTTLTDCRPFVYLNDLAYISSGTIDTPSPEKQALAPHDEVTDLCLVIPGLERDFDHFIERGAWPSGREWGRKGNSRWVTLQDLPALSAVIETMAESVETEKDVKTLVG